MDFNKYIRNIPNFPKPGILFKDITPLLATPGALEKVVDALASGFGHIDKVTGIEARGFILAAPVACRLRAGLHASSDAAVSDRRAEVELHRSQNRRRSLRRICLRPRQTGSVPAASGLQWR